MSWLSYRGKSTGTGSLSLWTHNLKDIDILPEDSSSYYNGPAVKVSAGVMSGELYEAVARQGYRVEEGTCANVGVAGRYPAGGGHSLLAAIHGMAANNAPE